MAKPISLDETVRAVFGKDTLTDLEDSETEQTFNVGEGILISYFPASNVATVEVYLNVDGTIAEVRDTLCVGAKRIEFIEKRGYAKTEEYGLSVCPDGLGARFESISVKDQTDLDKLCTIVKEARDMVQV
ncbi:hypothetical protein HY493_03840 [Candidatus Woesearchaeota archaeon]|nr:hypothetical protein [Candidatus Woesearchaeota archaeon]